MTRIRLTLEDDEGRKITSEKEHIYDLPGGMQRLVDMKQRWNISSSRHCQSWKRSS